MNKEKELLRQQLELLAEQSGDALEGDLARLSSAMCEVYRELVRDRLTLGGALFFLMCLNSLVSILVHIKKTFRRHT